MVAAGESLATDPTRLDVAVSENDFATVHVAVTVADSPVRGLTPTHGRCIVST